jgi:hypothetical protein
MSFSEALRVVGPVVTLSVGIGAHAQITVKPFDGGNDQVNYAAFQNTGATTVAVTVAPATTTTIQTPVFPVDGTNQGKSGEFVIVLAPAMQLPQVYAVPGSGGGAGFNVAAIGSAAGPSIIYITPVGDQS